MAIFLVRPTIEGSNESTYDTKFGLDFTDYGVCMDRRFIKISFQRFFYSLISLRCLSDDIEVSLDIVVWVGIRLNSLVNFYFI